MSNNPHYLTGQPIIQHLLYNAAIYQLHHRLIYGIIVLFDIRYGIPGIITLDYPIITLGYASGYNEKSRVIMPGIP